MTKRIPHIFEDGIEKKRCSKCKEYYPLNHYSPKKDRADGLSNECARCRLVRNKRRANPAYNLIEEDLKGYIKEDEDKQG